MYAVPSSLDTRTPIMLLSEEIGYDISTGRGVDGASFQRELLQLDTMGYDSIKVRINSPGGVVMDGYAIYNSILETKTPVDTYCDGMAASIAAVIFMAGRKRVMADYGRLMFHNPFGGDDKKSLDAIRGSIVTMISSRCDMSEDDVKKMMDKTSWITPKDAIEAKFATYIQDSGQKNIPHGNAKDFYKQSNLILNSILNDNTRMDTLVQSKVVSLGLIANYLGLNTEASENSILSEIQSVLNKAKMDKVKSDEEMEDVKKALKACKQEMEDKKAEYDKLCKQMEDFKQSAAKDKKDLEDKAKAAEDKEKETKGKKVVEDAVKLGKIKNDAAVIAKWVNMFVADGDGTESIIKELPTHKTAPVIKFQNKEINEKGDADVDPNEVPMSALELMAKVQNSVNHKTK